jgi:protein-L-isoaspartate(D-aspartate) O-methyltransferase
LNRAGPPAKRPSRFPLGLDKLQARAPGAASGPSTSDATLRPQRPVHEAHAAARDASRQVAASGVGLDSAAVRARMVQRLCAAGLRCEPVIAAFSAVPRHAFVDTALAAQAYEDTSLPIGLGQTISKPSVVSRMLALLFEGEAARERASLGSVLEIGTGCGYQTALLARLGTRVVSIERLRALHDKARGHLARHPAPAGQGADLRLLHGDGRLGHLPGAPYDAIVAAAGGDDLPAAWLEQLAVGGRLVAPMFDAASGGQALLVVDRGAVGYTRRIHEGVHFVPLKSGVG